MEKEAFLERIRSERARLDEVLSRITEERLLESPAGSWTGKDQLAHLAAWHRIALARVIGRSEGEMFGWPEGTYEELDLDGLNARFHEQFRDRSLSDVQKEFAASYDQLLDAIETRTDTDLDRLWLDGAPDRGTLAQMIAANTHEHYEEHIQAFNALAAE
jgi:hypothetical protein